MGKKNVRSAIRQQFIIEYAHIFSEHEILAICNVYRPIPSEYLQSYNGQRDLVSRLVAEYTNDPTWHYLFALYSLSVLQWDTLIECLDGNIEVTETGDSLIQNAFDRYRDISQ